MIYVLNIISIIFAIILFRTNDLTSRIIILVVIVLPFALLISVILTFNEKKKSGEKKKNEKKKDEFNIGTIIGIDLGTTNSRVGVYKNGQMEIIANDQGKTVTPSYVAFSTGGEVLIGDTARGQLNSNPENTIVNVQRLMGCQITDLVDQNFLFEVVEENSHLHIKVQTAQGKKTFAPELITAMIIGKLKELAEKHLREKVTHAIITVPANFNNAQKQAIETAVNISGLKVSRLVSAPSAAAVSYVLDKKKRTYIWTKVWNYVRPTAQKVLVFDLGGGHFDVSLISIHNGDYKVLSTHGDTRVGGEDFNDRIINYFIKLYKEKTGRNIRKDKKVFQKLRIKVEEAKIALSSCKEWVINETLFEDDDFAETLTRAKFEELNKDLFDSILESTKIILEDANVCKEDIDEIVLAGGCSHIPRIQQLVKDFFKREDLCLINDEAVISGAAAQASVLCDEGSTDAIKVQDVTPFSLGVQHADKWMKTVIPRNTPIPTEMTERTGIMRDYQTSVIISIYEGEHKETKYNHFLGELELTGIRRARADDINIDLTLTLDSNGILHVSAKEEGTDNQEQIRISYDHRMRSRTDIENMIEDFRRYVE